MGIVPPSTHTKLKGLGSPVINRFKTCLDLGLIWWKIPLSQLHEPMPALEIGRTFSLVLYVMYDI